MGFGLLSSDILGVQASVTSFNVQGISGVNWESYLFYFFSPIAHADIEKLVIVSTFLCLPLFLVVTFKLLSTRVLTFQWVLGGNQVQLTLEWHRFELQGSAYTWVFFYSKYSSTGASQVVLVVKNLPANASAGDVRHRFDPWVRKIPWRREWQPTLVFLPGKFNGQRNLVGYSP